MPSVRLYLAPDDDALTENPSWSRIDNAYNVRQITIDRGRENEMSRTGVGSASVALVDQTGDFDPTNTGGLFFGRLTTGQPMGPLVQAYIGLTDTDDVEWVLFRGFISRLEWSLYQTEAFANVTLDLVDGLAILAACEMAPDGTFGDAVIDGNIVFDEDEDTDAVQTRMTTVLDQLGWPSGLRVIFTGNVSLQKTVYAPRSTVLQVIQDAADAEFPFVSNVYIGGPRNPGCVVFHGRYARFNPSDPTYDIETWSTGDDTYAEATVGAVRLSPPLVASLDDANLYNAAIATPQNIDDGDIAAQYVTDTVAAGKQGLRTWSAENLATFGGEVSSTALEETKLMADYVVDNFAAPAIRCSPLTIKSRDPASLRGVATWDILTQVEISDRLHVTTTHGGGGGFDHGFYVEGIHYVMRPGGTLPYIELTLDVSPDSYYDANPFTDEVDFRFWVTSYDVPFDPDAEIVDYDMRGYWRAIIKHGGTWETGDHFPDKWKTPYDTSFSDESMYATEDCPFHWVGDDLVDSRDDSIVFGPPEHDPLFDEEGPAFYAAAYAHNSPFAVAGPYQTDLS